MKECDDCGRKNPNNAAYCGQCGRVLALVPIARPAPPIVSPAIPPPKRAQDGSWKSRPGRMLATILFVAGLLLLIPVFVEMAGCLVY